MVHRLSILAVLISLLAACGGAPAVEEPTAPAAAPTGAPAATQAFTPTEGPTANAATRTVTHSLGAVEVPANPQRVAVLDAVALDTALAVGHVPYAVPTEDSLPAYLRSRLAKLSISENIGSAYEPSLERIAQLEPDLVLTIYPDQYRELSQIAPTVIVELTSAADWRQAHLTLADALGRADAGRDVLDAYQRRAEQLGADLADALVNPEVSVMRASAADGNFRIDLRDLFNGLVLSDAQVRRPANQDRDGLVEQISLEMLSEADGDALFVYTSAGTATAEVEAEAIAALQQSPLWSSLRVVQQQRVFVVGDHWLGTGPLAASQILDDIERCLLKE